MVEFYLHSPYAFIASCFFIYFLIPDCEAIGTAATPGLLCQPRVIMKMIVRSRWNVDWQGKPKFSEKTCPRATFVHHKIPHDQTRFWTRAAAVGSRRLTAWAMARPYVLFSYFNFLASFRFIEKIKGSLWDNLAVGVSVYPLKFVSFSMRSMS
jgi:hypothetical protein